MPIEIRKTVEQSCTGTLTLPDGQTVQVGIDYATGPDEVAVVRFENGTMTIVKVIESPPIPKPVFDADYAIIEARAMRGQRVDILQEIYASSPPKRVPITAEHTPGRNSPCPCGSGKKSKKCCHA